LHRRYTHLIPLPCWLTDQSIGLVRASIGGP
jgi:hypothetical protein